MKKLVIPVLVILVIIAGTGSYFVGFGQGKSAIKKEIQAKEEAYRKSSEAAKEKATKYLTAFKFGDAKEGYSYTCPEFKEKITEQRFASRWEKITEDLTNEGTLIQDFPVESVVINGETAKVRFTQVYYNPVTKEFRSPAQSEFQLVNGEWCVSPSTDAY